MSIQGCPHETLEGGHTLQKLFVRYRQSHHKESVQTIIDQFLKNTDRDIKVSAAAVSIFFKRAPVENNFDVVG